MKYRFVFNLEYGYRLEVLNNNGFVKDTYDIGLDEIKENLNDMCKLATETEKEKEQLLDTLRTLYPIAKVKTITFSLKEKI